MIRLRVFEFVKTVLVFAYQVVLVTLESLAGPRRRDLIIFRHALLSLAAATSSKSPVCRLGQIVRKVTS